MIRRRRPQKDDSTHFSFDSFLDLVTNVVGIIIRLILVTWVGARSYHASMTWLELDAPPRDTKELKVSDDPLQARIDQSKNDLDDAKTKLLKQVKDMELAEHQSKDAEQQLVLIIGRRKELEAEEASLKAKNQARGINVQQTSLSVAQVRQRSKQLLEEIKKVEAEPGQKKELKYHAPLSRAVDTEELFFECRAGRVTYIDLPAFMREVKGSIEDIGDELKTTFRTERHTSNIGPFRMRYAFERERGAMDAGGPGTGSYRYSLTEWLIEPITNERGERKDDALKQGSTFRRLVDPIDARLTTVTFWVYPDSFELFRHLRDHLYERGHDVAGRPLPTGVPIMASRNGTASRGQ